MKNLNFENELYHFYQKFNLYLKYEYNQYMIYDKIENYFDEKENIYLFKFYQLFDKNQKIIFERIINFDMKKNYNLNNDKEDSLSLLIYHIDDNFEYLYIDLSIDNKDEIYNIFEFLYNI